MNASLLISIFLRSFAVTSAFGIFLITSYMYGPEGRGVISFVTSFYVILSLFLTMGLGRIFYADISKDIRSLRFLLDTASRQIWSLSAVGFVVLSSIYIFFKDNRFANFRELKIEYFLLCLGVLPFYMWQNYSVYFYSAARKIEIQDKVIFFGRSFLLIVMFFVAVLGTSIEYFLVCFSLLSVAVVFYEMQTLRNHYKDQTSKNWMDSCYKFRNLIQRCGWSFLDSIAQGMLLPAITFLLGFYLANSDLGILNFAIQMLIAFLFPFTVLQSKLQQSLVDQKNAKKIFLHYIKLMLPLIFIVIIGGLALPFIFMYIGLEKFQASALYLRGLILSVPLFALAYLFQSLWIGLHRPKVSSIVNLFMGFINAICVVSLASMWGPWAGVVSLFVSHLLGVLIQVYYLRKNWSSI